MPRLAFRTATELRIRVVYSRKDFANVPLPERVADYSERRHMGSKHRLLPRIHGVLQSLKFETAADPFVNLGSNQSRSAKTK